MSDAHAESHLPTYTRVIITLAVATAIEFGIAMFIGLDEAGVKPKMWMIGVLALIGLAAWKAILVGKIFMHLKYDPKILSLLAITPVVLATPLCAFCIWDGIAGPGF